MADESQIGRCTCNCGGYQTSICCPCHDDLDCPVHGVSHVEYVEPVEPTDAQLSGSLDAASLTSTHSAAQEAGDSLPLPDSSPAAKKPKRRASHGSKLTPRSQIGRSGRCHCLRCGWRWEPQIWNSTPKHCGRCRSPRWNVPPELSEPCPYPQCAGDYAIRHDIDGKFYCERGHSWQARPHTSYPEHPKWQGYRNERAQRQKTYARRRLEQAVRILGHDEAASFMRTLGVDDTELDADWAERVSRKGKKQQASEPQVTAESDTSKERSNTPVIVGVSPPPKLKMPSLTDRGLDD